MENDKEYYSKFRCLDYKKANSKTLVNAVEFELWNENESRPRQAILKKVNYSTKSEREVEFLKKSNIIEPNHTVKFYFAYPHSTKYFIFMEYCKRGSLSDILRERAKSGEFWTEPELLSIMIHLSSIVSKIHQNELYHRDIKPCNIFVTHSSELKLGDLGDSKDKKEEINTIKGTRYYMSPNLLKFANEKNIFSYKGNFSPEKEDIWSLGKTFLEMAVVTHQLNFSGYNFMQVKENSYELLKRMNYSVDFNRVLIAMLGDTTLNIYSISDFVDYFTCISRGEKPVLKDDVFLNSSVGNPVSKSSKEIEENKIQKDGRNQIKNIEKVCFTIKEALKESSSTFNQFNKIPVHKTILHVEQNLNEKEIHPQVFKPYNEQVPEYDEGNEVSKTPNVLYLNNTGPQLNIEKPSEIKNNSENFIAAPPYNTNSGSLLNSSFSSEKEEKKTDEKKFSTFSSNDSKNSTNSSKSSAPKKCSSCSKINPNITLRCNHSYHETCLNNLLTLQIMQAESFKDIHCTCCFVYIDFWNKGLRGIQAISNNMEKFHRLFNDFKADKQKS